MTHICNYQIEMYFYYFLNKAICRTYSTVTLKCTDINYHELHKTKSFHIFKGYEATDDGLKKYAVDFQKWTTELMNNEIFKLDYLKFKTHKQAVDMMFKKLCHGKYEHCEPVDATEYKYIEACNNSGLRYCKPQKCESYGYDFKAFFATILNSHEMQIPSKRGKEYNIDELDMKKLLLGYYRVEITSNDESFNKIFNYSKCDVYTDISILLAHQCQKLGMNVKIELTHDEYPNCYLYGKTKKDNIMYGHNVFNKWYNVLFALKDKFPKNKLIKHLLSSIWGVICQHKRIYKTDKEIEEEKINVSYDYDPDYDYYIRDITMNKKGEELNQLVSCKQPYHYNLARMKPFLLSRSRYLTAKIGLLHVDNLVRIQTDGIVFDAPFDDVMTKYSSFPTLLKEEKSTGLIEWFNVNSYFNHTTQEMHGYHKDEEDLDCI